MSVIGRIVLQNVFACSVEQHWFKNERNYAILFQKIPPFDVIIVYFYSRSAPRRVLQQIREQSRHDADIAQCLLMTPSATLVRRTVMKHREANTGAPPPAL
jgi:hypothetical protein